MAETAPHLRQSRPLRFVEDRDGFRCALIDRQASQLLHERRRRVHLIMVVLFVTLLISLPALIVALLNQVLTPRFASWSLRCSAHGLTLERRYTRTDPTGSGWGEGAPRGPGLFGRGEPEEPVFLPFSEIELVTWDRFSLTVAMADGQQHRLRLTLTDSQGIERLGRRLVEVHGSYLAGTTLTRSQAQAERARLAAVVKQA